MSVDRTSLTGAVVFTFLQAGNAVKVTAMCESTLVEVTVIAPLNLSQRDMQRLALNKLQMMVKKYNDKMPPFNRF